MTHRSTTTVSYAPSSVVVTVLQSGLSEATLSHKLHAYVLYTYLAGRSAIEFLGPALFEI